MAWPRLVWGETSRERELRALADSLARHAEELRRRRDDLSRQLEAIAANDAAREQAVKCIRDAMKTHIAERDEANRLLADAEAELHEERVKHSRMVSAADDLAARLIAAEAERDESRRGASEARLTLGIVARNLRRTADDIEPREESQDDRPATDDGTEGAGMKPE